MPYEPPTQLASPPTRIVNALNESPLEQLRDVVKYAEVLAEHKEREARLGEEADQDDCDTEYHLDSIHPSPGDVRNSTRGSGKLRRLACVSMTMFAVSGLASTRGGF